MWSAPFGLILLDTVVLRSRINALDIGCGTGFPLLELAQRLGTTCQVYGIDPWEKAIERINFKIKLINIKNVKAINGMAEKMSFKSNFFDLIVSNNGINNVTDPEKVLEECFRISRAGAQMVLTVNLPGTMKEFYQIYEQTLKELGKKIEIQKMKEHIFSKRKPLSVTKKMIEKSGFRVVKTIQNSFQMRFRNGSALFSHFFIQLGFLEPWKSILSPKDTNRVFNILEKKLNQYSEKKGELSLTVPIVCLDCRKK